MVRSFLTVALMTGSILASGVYAHVHRHSVNPPASVKFLAEELPDIQYSLPGSLEDAFRIIVMALAGLTLGLLFLIVEQFSKLKLDKADLFLRPFGVLAISFFLLTLFVGIEVSSRFKLPYITWRTPLAAVAYICSVGALAVVLFRVRQAVRRAKKTGAVVKMTVTDTGKPGPDIDLTDGTPVVHADAKQDAYDAGHKAAEQECDEQRAAAGECEIVRVTKTTPAPPPKKP